MAHELENDHMAFVGETPWHGLGKRVLPDLSTEQFLIEAGLNWSVEKCDLVATLPRTEEKVPVKTHQALIRDTDRKVLSVVTDSWQPTQNAEAFGFFHEFVEAGGMTMHTAGSLYGGQLVWALARIEEDFEVFGGDRVDSYLLFTNPHIYGKNIDIRFTPIRVVCANTLCLSLKGKDDLQVQINHRKKFDPDLAKAALGMASRKLGQYKEAAIFLGSKEAKPEKVKDYFGTLMLGDKYGTLTKTGKPRTSQGMSILNALLESQPGHQYAEGSWWQPFNAVTRYFDHIIGADQENRLAQSWYWANRRKKTEALELALDFANKS